MINTKCLHCQCSITKANNSDEHIFPQAIGGNLTIRNVFCKECNSKLGKSYDTKLVDNFHFFRNLFNVHNGYKRNRKRYKFQTKDTPLICYVSQEGNLGFEKGKYQISEKEALLLSDTEEKLITNFAKIKSKNPSASMTTKEKRSNELYDFQVLSAKLCFATGDKDVSFSVMKTAMTAFLYLGGNYDEISHFPNVFYPNLYPSRLVSPIGINQLYPEVSTESNISHSVKIIWSSEKRAIFAIIELFNSFQYTVILSNRYFGNDQEKNLSQNCITGKKNEIILNFSKEKFFNFLSDTVEEQKDKILNSWKTLRELTHLKMISAGLGKKIGKNSFGIEPNTVLKEEHVTLLFPRMEMVERKEFLL